MTQLSANRLSVRNDPTPLVAVDLVLMTVDAGTLKVLMIIPPQATSSVAGPPWVLPGAFVQFHETVEETAARVLREKANLSGLTVEQFHVFSAVDRDPRDRVLSVGFLALVPFERLEAAAGGRPGLALAYVAVRGDEIALQRDGQPLSTGYDHAEIIQGAVRRLRARLDGSTLAFGLLPERFTLLELQRIHEIIRGRSVNKPAFRKRILEAEFDEGGTRLIATGTHTSGRAHRPAELYQLSRQDLP